MEHKTWIECLLVQDSVPAQHWLNPGRQEIVLTLLKNNDWDIKYQDQQSTGNAMSPHTE